MRVHVLGSAAGGGFPQELQLPKLRRPVPGHDPIHRRPAEERGSALFPPHRHTPHRGDTIGVRVEDINTQPNSTNGIRKENSV